MQEPGGAARQQSASAPQPHVAQGECVCEGGVQGPFSSLRVCVCVPTGEAADGDLRVQRAEQRHQQAQAEAGHAGGEAAESRGGSSQRRRFKTNSNFSALALHLHSCPPPPQERRKEEALNQRLRRQVSDYQAPGVEEYLRAKETHRRLQQSVCTWEKKVEVVQVASTPPPYPSPTRIPSVHEFCHQDQLELPIKLQFSCVTFQSSMFLLFFWTR